jgi:aspartate-semialdehyde dehydrogenase
LHKKKYNIKRVIVSTYQSITGTGVKAVQQLENEYALIVEYQHINTQFIEMLHSTM